MEIDKGKSWPPRTFGKFRAFASYHFTMEWFVTKVSGNIFLCLPWRYIFVEVIIFLGFIKSWLNGSPLSMPKVRHWRRHRRENLLSVRNSKKLVSCTDLGRMLEIRDNVLNHFVDALWRKQFVHSLESNDTWGAALAEKLSILELFATIPATPLVLKYTVLGWCSGSHRCCTPLLSPHLYRGQT